MSISSPAAPWPTNANAITITVDGRVAQPALLSTRAITVCLPDKHTDARVTAQSQVGSLSLAFDSLDYDFGPDASGADKPNPKALPPRKSTKNTQSAPAASSPYDDSLVEGGPKVGSPRVSQRDIIRADVDEFLATNLRLPAKQDAAARQVAAALHQIGSMPSEQDDDAISQAGDALRDGMDCLFARSASRADALDVLKELQNISFDTQARKDSMRAFSRRVGKMPASTGNEAACHL